MKVGILGTRGIPNNYGGFEQFAQYLAAGLIEKGCQVSVYNSHDHPYQKPEWKKVEIIHCFDPEYKIGTAGQFIYDFNCILDSRKRDFDILLQLGYTSSSVWSWLMPRKTTIVTNMDGLEWKRSKYSKPVQKFLKKAEKWAVHNSDTLVSDSIGIREYLKGKYKVDSTFIPYGAEKFENPSTEALQRFNLQPQEYDMLIARLEPENNIETILDGVVNSSSKQAFLVIGNHETAFGNYLKSKFKSDKRIKFLGAIYDQETLNNLRFYCRLYFHGHSVGGTNPSLLEAMASRSLICAHDNVFNKSILENEAFYFQSSGDVKKLLESKTEASLREKYINGNLKKIDSKYDWENIITQYHSLMTSQF